LEWQKGVWGKIDPRRLGGLAQRQRVEQGRGVSPHRFEPGGDLEVYEEMGDPIECNVIFETGSIRVRVGFAFRDILSVTLGIEFAGAYDISRGNILLNPDNPR
jgi:hypothetical protein